MSKQSLEWWPDGCYEQYVRECNCQYCADLIAKLSDHRAETAKDGKHASLDAFGQ